MIIALSNYIQPCKNFNLLGNFVMTVEKSSLKGFINTFAKKNN